jgi:hypothetical protein
MILFLSVRIDVRSKLMTEPHMESILGLPILAKCLSIQNVCLNSLLDNESERNKPWTPILLML